MIYLWWDKEETIVSSNIVLWDCLLTTVLMHLQWIYCNCWCNISDTMCMKIGNFTWFTRSQPRVFISSNCIHFSLQDDGRGTDSEHCTSIKTGCLVSLMSRYYSGISALQIQTWQIHTRNKSVATIKEFICKLLDVFWWSCSGRNEVWVNRLFWKEQQTHRTCSQPSSVSGHPARIAFLSGFQFGFGDKCRGQAALGLRLQGDRRARAVASHLVCGRWDYEIPSNPEPELSHDSCKWKQRHCL